MLTAFVDTECWWIFLRSLKWVKNSVIPSSFLFKFLPLIWKELVFKIRVPRTFLASQSKHERPLCSEHLMAHKISSAFFGLGDS